MLFAGLQGEPQGATPMSIDGDTDQTARQCADVSIFCCDIRRVRPAETHRHTEPLRRADGDGSAEFARRREQRKSKRVGGYDGHCTCGVELCDRLSEVVALAVCSGILQNRPKRLRGIKITKGIADAYLPAECLSARSPIPQVSAGGSHDRRKIGYAHRRRCACAIAMASAAAVASSSSDALAISRPVRSATIVWKFNKASRRPWLISG